LTNVAKLLDETPAATPPVKLEPGEVLMWSKKADSAPVRVRIVPGQTERRRHFRKYAEGDLGRDRSFYFRGPQGKLKLQAQNLNVFTQLAERVDDETWDYHLKKGDYSHWFRTAIKDEELANLAEKLQRENGVAPENSREIICNAIAQKYTIEG